MISSIGNSVYNVKLNSELFLNYYHVEEERTGIKIRVLLSVFDLVSALDNTTALYLYTRVVDSGELELLHIPHTPG